MIDNALFWLALNIVSILILSFYSMMEMACVSFNKIRLQYYLSQGNARAQHLNYLLHKPERLFGTTLIGVNVAMMFGSEFARQFHSAIGINPDWAPLSQVMIVVIFGELAPMFAARRYAEHVAMLGIDLLYASAKLMAPILWIIGLMTKAIHFYMGKSTKHNIYLNQEELQKIFETVDEEGAATGFTPEFDTIVSNIFNLRNINAEQVMTQIDRIFKVPSNCTIGEMREILKKVDQKFLPIYHRSSNHIVGIAFPRDLLRVSDKQKVNEYARQPWFITKRTGVIQILKQFRFNKQNVAVVLNEKGEGIGILTLDDVVEEVFGNYGVGSLKNVKNIPLIERTFPADTSIDTFNKMYNFHLDDQGTETLGELVTKVIGHHPTEGESVFIAPFEFKVKEASILDIKLLTIKTRI